MDNHLPLFSLEPQNERAQEVVLSERNKYLVHKDPDGTLVLGIGHVLSKSESRATLATLGRHERSDIVVESTAAAEHQCSFEFNLETNFILFFDRSRAETSQVYGPECHLFLPHRDRKVVVHPGLNEFISFGGHNRDFIQFRLRWYQDRAGALERARYLRHVSLAGDTQLVVDSDSESISPRVSPFRDIEPGQQQIRWHKLGDLGSGAFGHVYEAVNTDDGTVMAIKTMKQPEDPQAREKWKKRWLREAKILSGVRHLHIVEYIGSQCWDGEVMEIFMALKEGTLQSLVMGGGVRISRDELGDIVLNHILQAIDFLATNFIVHLDIKPDNILYSMLGDRYLFQLGDFGACHHEAAELVPLMGAKVYMAPDLPGGRLTHKADVWSLYVTMLWLSGNAQFRSLCAGPRKSLKRISEIISECTLNEEPFLGRIREMAEVNPDERASAAQMLVKCYGGVGLSTPRHRIPPLSGQL
ncbi:kinase-like domain-containing protein [Xylaria grammica]|nr:kinase-like domain-containing protein [Xylaria grammica]